MKGFTDLTKKDALVPRKKESRVPSGVASYAAARGYEQPEHVGSLQDFVDVYSTYVWVHVCVAAIAEHCAEVPLRLYRTTRKGTLEQVLNSYPAPLLRRPNPHMSPFEFKEAIQTYKGITGNVYIEKVRDMTGRIVELYPLQSHRMKIVPDKIRRVKGYVYVVGTGQEVKFYPDEIIHIKHIDPEDDFYGLSPMAAGAISAQLDMYALRTLLSLYKNSARPDAALETDNELEEEDYERLRQTWAQAHRGVDKAYRIAILEQGLKYRSITLSPKDAESIRVRKDAKGEVFATYNMQPVIVGDPQANYATTKVQERLFYRRAVQPNNLRVADKMNMDFEIEMPSNFHLAFDYGNVEALKEDRDKQSRMISRYTVNDIIVPNEARRWLDCPFELKPVPWGDEPLSKLKAQWKAAHGINGDIGTEDGMEAEEGLAAFEVKEKYLDIFNKSIKSEEDGDDILASALNFDAASLEALKNSIKQNILNELQ